MGAGTLLATRHAIRDENVRGLALIEPMLAESSDGAGLYPTMADLESLGGLPTFIVVSRDSHSSSKRVCDAVMSHESCKDFVELLVARSDAAEILSDKARALDGVQVDDGPGTAEARFGPLASLCFKPEKRAARASCFAKIATVESRSRSSSPDRRVDSSRMESKSKAPVEFERALEGLSLSANVLEQVRSLIPRLLASPSKGQVATYADGMARLERVVRTLRAWLPDQGTPAVLSGSHPPVNIPTLLGFLSLLRESGVLLVRADGCLFTITIMEGDVVHGLSEPRPPHELLGQVLIDAGAIDADRLSAFLQRHSSDDRLGEALQKEELVSAHALDVCLKRQLHRLFERMFSAERASFEFHQSTAPLAAPAMRMNVTQLLLQSALTLDETRRRARVRVRAE